MSVYTRVECGKSYADVFLYECLCVYGCIHIHSCGSRVLSPPHNEGQTVKKGWLAFWWILPQTPSTLLSSPLFLPLPPLSCIFFIYFFCSLEAAASISGQESCKRILQCGIAMATAMVPDIHNAESGTVDSRDKNNGLRHPSQHDNACWENFKHPHRNTCPRLIDRQWLIEAEQIYQHIHIHACGFSSRRSLSVYLCFSAPAARRGEKGGWREFNPGALSMHSPGPSIISSEEQAKYDSPLAFNVEIFIFMQRWYDAD